MKLRDLMTSDVRACKPDDALSHVAKTMADLNVGSVPIVDGQKVVGIITDRDIVLRAVAHGKDIRSTKALECMTQPVTTASSDTDAHAAADLMAQKQIRRLPVVEGDRLVGIIALGDLATEQIHIDEAGHALSDISAPAQPGAH